MSISRSRLAGRLVAVAAALAVGLAACGGSTGTKVTQRPDDGAASAASMKIPAPKGEPVLTVSGAIAQRNAGNRLVFDLRSLERLPTTELDVYEPFLKKRVTFTGVDMKHILAAAGVKDGATTAHFVALDDYKIDMKVDLLQRAGVVMAIRDSGKKIPIAAGGPIRIVFGDDNSTGEDADLWIWSVESIEIS